jgi:hypothetical protein
MPRRLPDVGLPVAPLLLPYNPCRKNVVEKVLRLLKRKERWLVVAGVRFLRTCIGTKVRRKAVVLEWNCGLCAGAQLTQLTHQPASLTSLFTPCHSRSNRMTFTCATS